MRIRHKVPAIFSLSMVDMLCCALGCVILVWLLNAKQSEDEADERQHELAELRTRAEADRAAGHALLVSARAEYANASERLKQLLDERGKAAASMARLKSDIADLQKSKEALEKARAAAQALADDLTGRLKASAEKVASLEADLKAALARVESERNRLADERKRARGLDGDLSKAAERLKKEEAALARLRLDYAAMSKQHDAERTRAEDLATSLAQRQRELNVTSKSLEASSRTRAKLERSLTAKDAQIKELEKYRDRHAAAVRRAEDLEGKLKLRSADLDLAQRRIDTLERGSKEQTGRLAQAEKDRRSALADANLKVARLEREKTALRQAAENRFAGITLTGKRVIFLVDTSGSMTMLDSMTDAPHKWREVCTTVSKVLRSMPDIESYQVITFAKTIDYPLGSVGKWLANDAATPDKVYRSLSAIKPSGGTNMYIALEAAFAYRAMGLDTIYLLSDGLPNQGEGVSLADRNKLTEMQRSQKLGRYVLSKLKSTWNRPLKGSPPVRINTIGFFYESPELGAFLWALARDNDGSFVGMSTRP